MIMRNLIYKAIILSTALNVAADDFAEKFAAASAKMCSPGVEQDFDSLSSEISQLDEKLTHLSESGFSSILLKSIPAQTNAWQKIARIAGQCHRVSLKLGCSFFTPGGAEERSNAFLSRLGWSACVVDIRDYAVNKNLVDTPRRLDLNMLADVLTPVLTNAEYSAVNNVVLGRDTLPQQGQWHLSRFFTEPVQPQVVNYLNTDLFTDSANQFLLAAQKQLDLNYGTVLNWIWFPSLSGSELVWSDGLDRWFNEQASLDLIGCLPVMAGIDVKGAAYSQSIRKRYQQGIQKFWREKFAKNVEPLIQEAGLNAGIIIDEIPLDPEETGSFFGVTVMNVSTNTKSRMRNRRAAGGARVFESKNITGRVSSSIGFNLKSAVDSMIIDGADSILFDESILEFTGDAEFTKINDLLNYLRRIQFVLQNSKSESLFLLCSDSIPESLNQYSFDSVNVMMLRRAEVVEGRLRFASGRRYSTVVFSEDVLCSKEGKKIASELKAQGVRVLCLDGEQGADIDAHRKLIADMNIPKLGENNNQPDLLPPLAWRSDQSQMDIRFVHCSDSKRDFYLIKNESAAAGMVTLTFAVDDFRGVARWQPMDGRIYEIDKFAGIDKFHTSIPTLIRPEEMFFIVFER